MTSVTTDNNRAARAYCFTFNNPTDDDILVPQSWEPSLYNYLVYQVEEGEQGTRHLQGYVSFSKLVRFNTAKTFFPGNTVHLEAAKGSAKQNQKYCTKEEGRLLGPFEFGILPEPGKRNDLLAVKEDIDFGYNMKHIAQNHFSQFIRYHRAFREYMLLIREPYSGPKTVICIYGPPGTGKSRWAFESYKEAFVKTISNSTQQWWDGYDDQSCVIIDDFYGWLPYNFLLRLTDRYPLSVEIKGGTLPSLISTVIFTSNKHPSEWYHFKGYDWNTCALKRRMPDIRLMSGDSGGGTDSGLGLIRVPGSPSNELVPRYRNGQPVNPIVPANLYLSVDDDELGIGC